MTFQEQLHKMDACHAARTWVGDSTLEEAWTTCPRADWMLWLANRTSVDHKLIVSATCACVRRSLHLAPEDVASTAIGIAEAWVRGEASLGQVESVLSSIMNRGVNSLSRVSYAAYVVANAVYYGAHAGLAVFCAADAIGDSDGNKRDKELETMAGIVRKHIPVETVKLPQWTC